MTQEIAQTIREILDILHTENDALEHGKPLLALQSLPRKQELAARLAIEVGNSPYEAQHDARDAIVECGLEATIARNQELLGMAIDTQKRVVDLLLATAQEEATPQMYGRGGAYNATGGGSGGVFTQRTHPGAHAT